MPSSPPTRFARATCSSLSGSAPQTLLARCARLVRYTRSQNKFPECCLWLAGFLREVLSVLLGINHYGEKEYEVHLGSWSLLHAVNPILANGPQRDSVLCMPSFQRLNFCILHQNLTIFASEHILNGTFVIEIRSRQLNNTGSQLCHSGASPERSRTSRTFFEGYKL
ncbi:hypothetical protein DL96DRAFT_1644829 [Flagelloscypha sp. PMI_526]|nr:hypothetical protein DL96DRAFT_1644829 [Flagelloscypha sp. PMI_526]